MALKVADLFAGIGGFSLATRGAGRTKLYCDVSPEAQAALKDLMARGKLDEAPIHDDVCTLHLPEDIDMGNSRAGKRKGMDDPRSGLIREVFRLVEESKPSFVFLENVKEVLESTNGTVNYIIEQFRKLGYRLAWMVVSAQDVGLPHRRNRFFALAVRQGVERAVVEKALAGSKAHVLPDRGDEPPRLSLTGDKAQLLGRIAMYGNSVVPPAVKLAFETLLQVSSQSVPSVLLLMRQPQVHLSWTGTKPRRKPPHLPSCGFADAEGLYEHDMGPKEFAPGATADVVLLPDSYKVRDKYVPHNVLPIHSKPVRLTMWATPRHGSTAASQVLTARTQSDLGTQLRFDHRTPEELRAGVPNAEFVRHLMGYPLGWV